MSAPLVAKKSAHRGSAHPHRDKTSASSAASTPPACPARSATTPLARPEQPLKRRQVVRPRRRALTTPATSLSASCAAGLTAWKAPRASRRTASTPARPTTSSTPSPSARLCRAPSTPAIATNLSARSAAALAARCPPIPTRAISSSARTSAKAACTTSLPHAWQMDAPSTPATSPSLSARSAAALAARRPPTQTRAFSASART
mmetsp:Transcript_29006/g.63485  ORF Transcript_29006/g.63485 Transcript_29006/m.63485 type:complete len:204 (+) Transcript_29006:248-859(+)